VKVKSHHFRRAKCSNSVALDILSIRSDLHRSVEGFCDILRVLRSIESRKLSRRGNSLRRAQSERPRAASDHCWWTSAKKIYWNGFAFFSCLNNWLVTLFSAFYCGKHCICRNVDRYQNFSAFSNFNSFGQKVMETAPSGKGSRSDLQSELGFTLAPRETDPTPVVTR